MAMFPDRDGEYMMTEPGSYVPGRNTNVVRIVMHQTWGYQANANQAPVNYDMWTKTTRTVRLTKPEFGVSAHFTVEADGRIFQHVDTKDGAKGTAAYAYNAIHIEFASRDEPLTNDQLFYGANLMSWITKQHPNVKLVVVGTGFDDPGDQKQEGITCHAFVEIAAKLDHPKKTCPGQPIIDQMNKIAVLASVRSVLP
jgi:N-acetyl-anhydromuramyl-L-alanine amidase AmpD